MDNANNLQIEFDWQDPGGAQCEELRATWASLSILIDNKPVTEVLDTKTKSVRNAIFLPLFPLAEWIADNWWFLQTEAEEAGNLKGIEFDRRHNCRWAREGFVLPSLRFVTLGNNVAAQWQTWEIPDAGIRFLSSGDAVISSRVFVENLREFVNAVVARLEESSVTGTTLHEQWFAIENADAEERSFCHASARLGVDPYAIEDQLEEEILDVAKTIRPELLDEFLSLANIDELTHQAFALKSASDAISTDADSVDALTAVRCKAPTLEQGANPWETGYRFASQLRQALNGGTWRSQSLEDLAGYLNIDHLDHCLLSTPSDCKFLDALTGTNQHSTPKVIIEKTRPDSRQFAFCRALFEHLTLPEGRFAAVSRLRTERQQMNRAFAAEFLAPHAMLKGDLSAATVGEEEIDDLAGEYGVSGFVIRHQIENHKLARISF